MQDVSEVSAVHANFPGLDSSALEVSGIPSLDTNPKDALGQLAYALGLGFFIHSGLFVPKRILDKVA